MDNERYDTSRDEFDRLRSDLLKALGHPTRLAILELLKDRQMCVCDIYEALVLDQSNVSQHLAVLRAQGVVTCTKDGLRVIYSVRNPEVFAVLELLDRLMGLQFEHRARILKENPRSAASVSQMYAKSESQPRE